MTEYLTVHRGTGRNGRLPKPFSREEENKIRAYANELDAATLLSSLTNIQDEPRRQRLIQEAYERVRRNDGS